MASTNDTASAPRANRFFRHFTWMRLLLLLVPVTVVLHFAHVSEVWQFIAAGLAIVPLAGLMGEATEHLAHRLGPGIGGLLNATFGNAAELIIALFALFKRAPDGRYYDEIVKASLTGSIIGNLLLVLGLSLFAGGLRYPIQRFSKTAAGVGGTLLVLAAFGLLVPAIFHSMPEVVRVGAGRADLEHHLSVGVCLLLIVTYILHLIFSLITHKDLYNPSSETAADEADDADAPWSIKRSALTLLIATVLVAWMSEILIGTVAHTSEALGLSAVFVGVILVAIVGNAAEHSTAVMVALKNKMDLSVGIAVGSALQIALFVAPVLVFVSYLRDYPMDLLFTTLEIVAVLLSVFIARMVCEDGESNWLEGAMLLMVYAVLAVAFFFHPGAPAKPLRTTTQALGAAASAPRTDASSILSPPLE
jgi:Ca2+:H+ antiporter